MKFQVQKQLISEVEEILSNNEIDYIKRNGLNLSANDLFQYFVVGGGLVSILNVLISYKNSCKAERKIELEMEDKRISIQATSKEELLELLERCERIIITDIK